MAKENDGAFHCQVKLKSNKNLLLASFIDSNVNIAIVELEHRDKY